STSPGPFTYRVRIGCSYSNVSQASQQISHPIPRTKRSYQIQANNLELTPTPLLEARAGSDGRAPAYSLSCASPRPAGSIRRHQGRRNAAPRPSPTQPRRPPTGRRRSSLSLGIKAPAPPFLPPLPRHTAPIRPSAEDLERSGSLIRA
ncbi:hypothetical protein CALCODRAFT_513858, partial [Calocera cornea HHB12733]